MRGGIIESSNSDANHVEMLRQNDRWGLGPMETSISDANHAVLHAQSDRWGLGPLETFNSHQKDGFYLEKLQMMVETRWDLQFLC